MDTTTITKSISIPTSDLIPFANFISPMARGSSMFKTNEDALTAINAWHDSFISSTLTNFMVMETKQQQMKDLQVAQEAAKKTIESLITTDIK